MINKKPEYLSFLSFSRFTVSDSSSARFLSSDSTSTLSSISLILSSSTPPCLPSSVLPLSSLSSLSPSLCLFTLPRVGWSINKIRLLGSYGLCWFFVLCCCCCGVCVCVGVCVLVAVFRSLLPHWHGARGHTQSNLGPDIRIAIKWRTWALRDKLWSCLACLILW